MAEEVIRLVQLLQEGAVLWVQTLDQHQDVLHRVVSLPQVSEPPLERLVSATFQHPLQVLEQRLVLQFDQEAHHLLLLRDDFPEGGAQGPGVEGVSLQDFGGPFRQVLGEVHLGDVGAQGGRRTGHRAHQSTGGQRQRQATCKKQSRSRKVI